MSFWHVEFDMFERGDNEEVISQEDAADRLNYLESELSWTRVEFVLSFIVLLVIIVFG